MSTDAWLTLAILLAVLVALFGRRVGPAPAMLGGCAALHFSGAVSTDVAFAGFSSEAPWIVAGLYVIAGTVQRSGVLDRVAGRVGGAVRGDRRSLVRLLIPATLASSVTANTPVVAALIPELRSAAARTGGRVRPVLLPLSYATILGGTLTVLGSSTNVAASSLLADAGLGRIEVVDLIGLAGPVAIVGLAYLTIASSPLLAGDRSVGEVTTTHRYEARLIVGHDSRWIGTTAASVAVELQADCQALRHGRPHDGELADGDVVEVVGSREAVVAARDRAAGADLVPSSRYIEAVVDAGSSLVGSRLGARTSANAVAFARRATDGSSDTIRRGDVLVLLAAPEATVSDDYAVASRLDTPPSAPATATPALVIGAATVVAASFTPLGLLRSVMAGVALLVVTRVVRPRDALRMVNLEIVVLIAAALGVSGAVVETGLAHEGAELLQRAASGQASLVAIVLVLVTTVTMTELLTNVAAVAIMVPVAVEVAALSDLDPRQLALAVVIAASASFLTPFGYQTNTMVWRPGGYGLRDFLLF